MTRRAALAALAAVVALPALARAQGAPVRFGRSRLEVLAPSGRRHAFDVELAQNAGQLSQGLMYRKELAPAAGMLFDFGRSQPVSMWMKNTLLSLDMLFIDAGGTVTGIAENTTPLSTDVISSPGAVRAVLEVNAGTASRLGIRPGDKVRHPIFGE